MGGFLRFLQHPIVSTSVQKLRAYQKILKDCPALSVTSAKQKKLIDQVNLLLQVMPIFIEEIKYQQGIDFSSDQFKAVKPGQLSEADQELLSKKVDQYLDAKEKFQKPLKQKGKK